MIKGTSRFGAELDSLADFVNFGVVPGLVLYFWGLHELKNVGWIAAMVFAICAGLRLARFNVMIDDPNRPAWAANYFVGVPAPMGAITVLLPIYLYLLGVPRFAPAAVVFTLLIAFLMVSRLPVFSGKKLGTRVAPEKVLLVFVAVILAVALLISYPWEVLAVGSIAYLAALPLSVMSYRRQEQAHAAAAAEAAPAGDLAPGQPTAGGKTAAPAPPAPADDAPESRPHRLN
jgi:CDP-diacylglycerol--serine O-phosphatidyltransferase